VLPATALVLGLLAALLAWPVPAAPARARWPRRDPLAVLVCWQAIGLAGGLSIIGALLVRGLALALLLVPTVLLVLPTVV
jgi:hypothetical protein